MRAESGNLAAVEHEDLIGKKLHPGDEVTFLHNTWRVTEERA